MRMAEEHIKDLAAYSILHRESNGIEVCEETMPFGRGEFEFDIVSYASNAEDIVLVRAFAECRGGFFVDVGAGDPEEGSVTKNLVDRLDWRGVNIEPLPEMLDRLRAARPKDISLGVALDTKPGKASFYRIVAGPGLEGGPGLSTLDTDIVEMHKATGWGVQELEVDVVTLESVLAEYASPGFELLKVDVEGREAAVLASADLRYWRPRVLVVESTMPDSPEPSHEKWEPLVIQAGYRLALFDGLNRFYARGDELELLWQLSIPANVFDRWIPFTWARRLGLELLPRDSKVGRR